MQRNGSLILQLFIKPCRCSSAADKGGKDCACVAFVWTLPSCKSSLVASIEGQLWILMWLRAWLSELMISCKPLDWELEDLCSSFGSALHQPCDHVILPPRTLISSCAKWRSWHKILWGHSCLKCGGQGSLCWSGRGAGLFVLCGSLAVGSLWSGGISGQVMSELGEVRTENVFLWLKATRLREATCLVQAHPAN